MLRPLSACRTTIDDEVSHFAVEMQWGGFRSIKDILALACVRFSQAPESRSLWVASSMHHGLCRLCPVMALNLKALRGKIRSDWNIVFVHINVRDRTSTRTESKG